MITFLNLPENQNRESYKNKRISFDHVIAYEYDEDENAIVFEMINGRKFTIGLHNLNPKKVIGKLDKLNKHVKLELTKADAK